MRDGLTTEIFTGLAAWAALPLRLALGAAFLAHGYPKLSGGKAREKREALKAAGVPPSATVLSGVVQIVGGAALIVGFLTPIVGVVMAAMMGVTVVLSKTRLEMRYLRGYELDIAYLAGSLSLVFLGGGPFSLDALLGL